MKVIGVRELRQHASRYLAQVEAGEEIAITNRGRTVARLIPVADNERGRESLIDAGVLTPASHPGGLHAITADQLPRQNLSAVLESVRDDR